jgi:hypothetical protein
MAASEKLIEVLGHRRVPLAVTIVAVLLCISSLQLGLQIDDYMLSLFFSDPPIDPEWSRSPARAFAFLDGDEERNLEHIKNGRIPWWSHPGIKAAFLRPVTGVTHWIDFRLWPDRPWLMHLHSLLWFAGAVFAASVLYRRLLLPAWTAGLAGLLFAVDNAHGLPAMWLANRNASIGVFFGLLALIAHDRWRRESWRPGAWVAPLALLLALLGGEIALAAGGYLFSYALFLDTGNRWRRIASLLPAAGIGLSWWVIYRALDFGAGGSSVYIDPGANPIGFVQVVIERAPILFFGQWALPSGLFVMLSERAADILWLVAVGLVVAIGLLVSPLLKRDRTARFFTLGMVLSLLPACAAFPDDRLLFFVGVGGMGLLSQFVAAVLQREPWLPPSPFQRLPFHVAFWALVVIHLVVAPLGLATTTLNLKTFGAFFERSAGSLPSDPAVTEQTILIVNTPSVFISTYGPLMQALDGHLVPNRTLVLGSSIYPTTISRPGPNTLTIRPDGGFLASPGSPAPGHETTLGAFHPGYFHQMLDTLYRDDTPFRVGQRIELGDAIVEIVEVTNDRRPAEVSFHFDSELEDPSLRWLQWHQSIYIPFNPPPVGETVVLPAVVFPW